MKVLHIAPGNLYGGVETILVSLAQYRHLCPEMEPSFAVCFEGRLSKELRQMGATVHLLGRVRASRPWTVWQARRQLRAILSQESFDPVVCHMSWAHAIFGEVAKRAGRKLVFYCHSALPGPRWLHSWAQRVIPNVILAASKDTCAKIRLWYPGVPVEVIYAPLPPKSWQPGRADRTESRVSLKTPEDAVVILQASRMEGLKGHVQHIRALGVLRDLPGWVCWFAGGAQSAAEKNFVENLKRLAQEVGVADRVLFLGERQDVPDLMQAADIYCQPNTSPEGFALVFLEAGAAGLPVVTSALGGALEVVNDETGLLAPPGDVAFLAQGLRRLIMNASERRQKGIKAAQLVRDLVDPARQLLKFHDFFARLAS